ncbi:MAG TPA: glycosyltransferase family 2 protein [Acidobacteriaceae bacterium]|nr:glycosyltransferase family 2 protein [Acidobacteriaceae bacterium]
MLHALVAALSIIAVSFVLCASLYVAGFAILGAGQRPCFPRRTAQTRFLVLVPAQNKGSGIEATLRSLRRANYPEELIRIAVIADNCNDNTAEVARSCGIEAWIRTDPQNPGKGQALSWAFDKAALAYDLAAVINPDTEVDPQFFAAMDSAFATLLRKSRANVVLQGRYLFAETAAAVSWFDQFTIASKAAENSFFYRPRTALRLANLIQGNGFCISRTALELVPYNATSVVEDAEYAVTLALHGISVVHVDEARVVSRVTAELKDTASERLLWASGIFSLLRHSVPELLRSALRQRRWQPAEMALMLLLTSRLLLVYATLISIVLLDSAYRFRHFDVVASALAASLLLQSIYLYLVLRKAGGTPIPFQTIVFTPFYVGFLGAMQLGAILGFKKRQLSGPMW